MAAKPKKTAAKSAPNKAVKKSQPSAKPKAAAKTRPVSKSKAKPSHPAPKAKVKPASQVKPVVKQVEAPKTSPAKSLKAVETLKIGKSVKPTLKIASAVVPPPKPIRGINIDEMPPLPVMKRPPLPAQYLKKQKQRLMDLQSHLLDSMEGMAKDSLRTRPEGSEASVGGMHMGDAGSDAYDRDFALSLLSKEQDALNEILEALKRIESRTYGYCEMTGKKISEERLEALPFTRFTREAQEQLERDQFGGRVRRIPQRSVFSLDEDAEGEEEEEGEEETPAPAKESSLDFMKE